MIDSITTIPNKLKRNFLTNAPNKVWGSDITYAKVSMDFLYLCVVIDLYSHKVVSYSVSEYIDTALATQVFINAFHMREFPSSLVFHSDQGTSIYPLSSVIFSKSTI